MLPSRRHSRVTVPRAAKRAFPIVLCTDGNKTVINPEGRTRLEIRRQPEGYVARLTSPGGRKIYGTAKAQRRIDHALVEGVKLAVEQGRIKLPPGCTRGMRIRSFKRTLVLGVAVDHPDGFVLMFEAVIKPYIGEGTIWYAKIGDCVNTRDEFDDPYQALICAASMLMSIKRWK